MIEVELHKNPSLWALTSHSIRRAQDPTGKQFDLTERWLRSVWAQPKLPNPQLQADALIEYLGSSDVPPAGWVPCFPPHICALIGTADSPADGKTSGLVYVLNHLKAKALIEEPKHPPSGGAIHLRLTFEGWGRYEELRRSSVESRAAFMAMDYNNPSVQAAFAEFVKGVAQTGYELRRLDQKPKAGLIDIRMRVEIRSAKFLVADLTDDNRGAYWESGFAEGAGKHVYYTCETSKFDKAKTHFDTEHPQTIKWVAGNLAPAVDELKSAIRNDLPTDARQSD